MKVQNRKDIIILIIILPIIFGAILYFSASQKSMQPPYSVKNTDKSGTSVMYETMKELDYPVNLSSSSVVNKDIDSVQIVVEPADGSGFGLEDEKLKEWINNGGKLVYLTSNWQMEGLTRSHRYKDYGDRETWSVKAEAYVYGKGFLIIGDSSILTNKTLTFSNDGAYWILQELDSWGYRSIDFNEYYHDTGEKARSLWRDIPIGIKVILYQLILVIIAILYRKGKRFGKTVPLHEEVERSENEYINTVTALYTNAGAWDTVLEGYYDNMIESFGKLTGESTDILKDDWINLWQEEKLDKYKKAKKLYDFIKSNDRNESTRSRKRKGKEYLHMISICEELNKVIEERRDKYWKLDI